MVRVVQLLLNLSERSIKTELKHQDSYLIIGKPEGPEQFEEFPNIPKDRRFTLRTSPFLNVRDSPVLDLPQRYGTVVRKVTVEVGACNLSNVAVRDWAFTFFKCCSPLRVPGLC